MEDFNAKLQALAQRVRTSQKDNHLIDDNKMIKNYKTQPSFSEKEVVLYQTEEGNINVSVYYHDESFWLTQKAMAEIFGCSTDNISLHLKNIFADGELDRDSVTEKISATATDGKNYLTQFYK
ncbi:MAG: hypothetical protein ACI4DQ_02220 [Lachnospiraceae bacterium]